MKVPLLDLQAQYVGMREEIRAEIDEVCDAQYFILGPKVEEFEKITAEYCGANHAVGVSSGTDALIIALMALDLKPGDVVITTPFTFFATVGSIARLGAMPVFVDIDPVTYNIDPEKLKATIESLPENYNVKAIMPVHLFGQSADMDPILAIAKERGIKVIEDGAQAIGVEYPSGDGAKKVGSMGDAGCFSFFPSKNLGGFGDGGLVTTNDAEFAAKMKSLRNHGAEERYFHKQIGGNFRLDALQAAVLKVKLQYLELWHEARRQNANYYDEALKDSKVQTPVAIYKDKDVVNYHIYNQYVVRVPNRDAVMESLQSAGIGCAVYYPLSLHMQECFKSVGYKEGDFPESEKACKEVLALPIYPELTREMQTHVVETLISNV